MDDAIGFLREQFRTGHELLRDTLADVTQEQIQWFPPGTANPLGATLAHLVMDEDSMIQSSLKGGKPLFASAWQGKTGLSPGPEGGDWAEWDRSVEVDLAAFREYLDAVQSALETYLTELNTAEYTREIERPGPSGYTVGRYLATITLPHLIVHTGEIACLKGLQGARGYAD